jgi:hypothetical protein
VWLLGYEGPAHVNKKEGRGNGGRGEGSRLGDGKMRWMEACYGGTGVMERSCAMARGKDISILKCALG